MVWAGDNEIWGFTILSSGRLTSNDGESVGCGEGVGIVPDSDMSQGSILAAAEMVLGWEGI